MDVMMQMSLVNQLLIAMPSLRGSPFSQTLIYVCEQNEVGTSGMIINKPTKHTLSLILDQMDVGQLSSNQRPLLFGGPVQPDRGFVIHRPEGHWQSSVSLIPGEVSITISNDIVHAIALDQGPKDALIVLGFVGWDCEQLEREIMDDAWLVCPFKSELLFQVPFAERWEAAGLTLGVHMNDLSLGSGHA